MMKRRVYIETTIPSFYYEVRTEPEMVARRGWTREWWDNHRQDYELVTSEPVIDEIEKGEFAAKDDALALIDDLPLLEVEESIGDIVTAYIVHHAMPMDPAGDALHLALASFHKCDFLLTWNCQHLANANKFAHDGYPEFTCDRSSRRPRRLVSQAADGQKPVFSKK
ncbi:MAG: type II toxin-antitoxin system VapC family toxin, partial [Planctomycetes bacterium]|nr:type II toxin-antitoxin system VapC family toxin [Planctomycetota bacterium]